MNKPLTMVIEETKNRIINICNESGLSPVFLDLIMNVIYSEIHSLAERQTMEEKAFYVKMLEEAAKQADKQAEIVDEETDSKK